MDMNLNPSLNVKETLTFTNSIVDIKVLSFLKKSARVPTRLALGQKMVFGQSWFDSECPYIEGSISVNKKDVPVKFLIDTGASCTILPKPVLEMLGLKPVDCKNFDTASHSHYLGVYYPAKIYFPVMHNGELVQRLFSGICCDWGLNYPCDNKSQFLKASIEEFDLLNIGVIGMDTLRNINIKEIKFDFSTDKVYLVD